MAKVAGRGARARLPKRNGEGMLSIADEVRQLRAELATCEARAAEIQCLLDEIRAACGPTVAPITVGTEAPPVVTAAPIAFLRQLASGPSDTGAFVASTGASRAQCLRILRSLAAEQLVLPLGRGSGQRWHLTDLGAARLAAGSATTDDAAARLAASVRQLTM